MFDKEINEILKLSGIDILNEISLSGYLERSRNLKNMLFHGTSLFNAYKIFESDLIVGYTETTPVNGKSYTGVSTSRNFDYSASFALQHSDEYHFKNYYLDNTFNPVVVFCFNKDNLKSKYKIVPYDYNSTDDTFYGKRTEQEEVVVGNIKNIKNITEKIVMNRDALTLFQYGAIGEFLIKRYYFLNNKEDEFYDDIFNIAIEENLTYDEDKDAYITSAGETLYPDDIYNIGLEKMIQKMFPKMNEFYEFLKDKKFEIYNN